MGLHGRVKAYKEGSMRLRLEQTNDDLLRRP